MRILINAIPLYHVNGLASATRYIVHCVNRHLKFNIRAYCEALQDFAREDTF